MGRAAWLVVVVVTFVVGWAVGGVGRKAASPPPTADQQATVTRLQQQVETLQARLRAREEMAAARASRSWADRPATDGPAPAPVASRYL